MVGATIAARMRSGVESMNRQSLIGIGVGVEVVKVR
jgi:hypothetical protein